VAPECRIVYVDNDPVVLAHARALLTGGRWAPPATSMPTCARRGRSWTAAQTLDFSQPVAVMMMAVLQHIHAADDPYRIVAALMGAVPLKR
jgi:hypothetical protein